MPKPQLLSIRAAYRKIVAVGGEPEKYGNGWRWVRGDRSLVLRHATGPGSAGKCTVELLYWLRPDGYDAPLVSYSGYVENTHYERLKPTLAMFAGGYWTLSQDPPWPTIRIAGDTVVMQRSPPIYQQYPLTGRVGELARECIAHRCPPWLVLDAIRHDTEYLE